MIIKEKIHHTDTFAVNLYKEGIFWMAYEQSAYAVCQIKPYIARKKYVKAVSAEVVSVGFAFLGAYIKPRRCYIGNRTKKKFR
ncbi:MAG: hypothetical protein LBI15_11865 [Dysgonamonadaceae bacterium]|jgi:hypothetical protein|nr:hypothetical protein [Dysgonamonadaceae bacterium]